MDESERARTGVAALVQCAAAYDYERDHSYGKRVNASKIEYFLEVACQLALLALWWIDERGTTEYLSVWEDGQMRAIAEGDSVILTFAIPVMRAIPALDCIWRVLEAARISWREAEHMNTESIHYWSLPDDAAFHSHPQFFIMQAKLECFLCGPDRVEASEVLDYLPQSDSCKWVRDSLNHVFSLTESLEVLISKAALACGDTPARIELAAGHTKAAVARHHTLQKVMHAQAALGCTLMTRGEASSSAEATVEALALLDVAHEAATKMKLGRYSKMIAEKKLHGHVR
jgi:hypothetical protein